MDTTPLIVPSVDEIAQRIEDCELELKSLKRLLTIAQYTRDANNARDRRAQANQKVPLPTGK
jgi:hypothetical protein